jgi:hypothetical protein
MLPRCGSVSKRAGTFVAQLDDDADGGGRESAVGGEAH